jgi:hypothetical protein
MRLFDLIPGADVVCALGPEELGLRMLPILAARNAGHPGGAPLQEQFSGFTAEQIDGYPRCTKDRAARGYRGGLGMARRDRASGRGS